MKTRSIGVLGAASFATAASMFVASGANADFIGWTSTKRAVTGGFLINVFAVTNNAGDQIASVSGGGGTQPGQGGSITTNSVGGFRQGTGTGQSVFAPSGSQNWTTLDSFLTVGGGYNTTNGSWTGNSATAGDPPWNVTYPDSETGGNETVSAFGTQSNGSGFTNPYTSTIPIDIPTTNASGQTTYSTGGWLLAGSFSVARDLTVASVANNRVAFGTSAGINYGSSSLAASTATLGFMVAQFYVTEWGGFGAGAKFIDFKMSANIRRPDGSNSSSMISFRIGEVPGPGALALLGLAGVASRRRRHG